MTQSLYDQLNNSCQHIALHVCADQMVEVTTTAKHLLSVTARLRDFQAFQFDQLTDLCAVDYLGYGQSEWDHASDQRGYSRARREVAWCIPDGCPARFVVVYHLLSTVHNQRLRLKVWVDEDTSGPLSVPSVTEIWACADWYEREAFDLMGIHFVDHPDMRRILTDYGFVGHPLRKDFPLIGHVEMRYDHENQRCLYQPVSIEPRTTVPKTFPYRMQDCEKNHD